MDNFSGKIAVVTGGGTGMGRELCLQLVQEGCAVAACDVIMENLDETKHLCAEANPDIKVTLHQCDVSCEEDIIRFRDEVVAEHGDKINLLFNNAGIGGSFSMLDEDTRPQWEKTFNVCWYGVYYSCRAFIPLLVNADEAHIVNTSSVNGFWASLGPNTPHTAYAAAKFAVKGFSEALITDLRMHAPHVGVSVVMPGHIGTSIAINSGKVLSGKEAAEMTEEDIKGVRERMMKTGGELAEAVMNLSDDQIRAVMHQRGIDFRDNAPTSAGEASETILDAVKAGKWRILVGDDAVRLDARVRNDPESAYEIDFAQAVKEGGDLIELIK
ncbi:MAG: SDR family NAD(P)-dependent oxidoreductase [Pseudomonadales bacterium]|jgi:NAD(P)-dependent dehydrogenase (short-subunit alcohol dehydrogenase family)|nr:SDR family NAD(P)-dependent oxidoreductase [Pseudomonadales bacterium]